MTKVIAHRGASADAPENTLRAFALAAEQGADMVELDVQRTADGALIVFHDKNTLRWNGDETPIAARTLTDLRETVRVGGEPIATFDEFCDWLRATPGMEVNVELKVEGVAADVVKTLQTFDVADRALISSFSDAALDEMRAAAPELPRAVLMGTPTLRPDIRLRESWPLPALRRIDATAWHPAWQIPLLDQIVPRVREAGFAVNVWTVNDPERLRHLLALGVDGIITDTPGVLRGIIEHANENL